MAEPGTIGALGISGRGLEALRSTRRWAFTVGILMLILAAIAAAGNFFYATMDYPPNVPPAIRLTARYVFAGIAVLALLIDGAFGWFALQYARRLGHSLRTGAPAMLEAAFWWQRRFWTLQGAMIMVVIVVYVIAIIAAIVLTALRFV